MAKTVKCRISLVVDPTGAWAAGGSDSDKGKFADYILDGVGQGEARYWVEVEVAVPEIATVQGLATAAEKEDKSG